MCKRDVITNNLAKIANKKFKRRIKVATLVPNTSSLQQLVSARAMEISEDWKTIRACIKF
ncbi:MAG: transposase [Candidatus Cloacimonetes bacterium]|nr:transposase [Candidatus Cloacimonadota bacterium]